jgi:hypothetical protein
MMRIITERDKIKQVVSLWSRTYLSGGYGKDKLEILEKLKLLNLNIVTAKEIENIIGNSSWTDLKCHECGRYVKKVVQVGEEPDYESATVFLCVKCIKRLYDSVI